MALDGIVTRAIVHELQSCCGARINKIHQPHERDIIFHLRLQGGNEKLLLSANPTYPRAHFTAQTFLNPAEAPMFCMLLRKHCEGGVIENIRQVGMERIIHIDIKQRDELGDMSRKRVIVELMGRHSNIILVDPASNTMVDGIHHITPAISSYRVVMPGFSYTEPPQQHKLDPLETDKTAFLATFPAEPSDAARWIVNTFTGISPLIATEIALRATKATSVNSDEQMNDAERLWQAFSDIMKDVQQHRYQPVSGLNAQGKDIFSAIALQLVVGTAKTYDSISQCMEYFYGDKAARDSVKQRVSDLLRFLQNEHNKNVKKLDYLQRDLEEAEDADQYRLYGELLFASLHTVSKGDNKIVLVNFYDELQREIAIPLDPQLNPSDNAQRYFKKYNKYKNSLSVIEKQKLKTYEEIAYINNLLQQLSHASMTDIEEIREELVQQGYLRDRARKLRKKKKNDRPALHQYISSEGIEIYVGKNNLQNEYLTNRLAAPNDTWLHTQDIPGSHVVIRSDRYGDATLKEAAQLAAYFSQARQSSSVPVDCTLIRHVRKPNGAKPGFVIYDHQQTMYITPDEEFVKQLPGKVKL